MMRFPALRSGLLVALVCSLLATGLVVAGPAAASEDPSRDWPSLPSSCTRDGGNMTYRAAPCYLTTFRSNRPTMVLWGDSHAWQHLPAVRPLARRHGVNLVMFMLGGCPPYLVRERTPRRLDGCGESNRLALKFVRTLQRRDRPVAVLLGGFWHIYRDLYRRVYVQRTGDGAEYPDSFMRSVRRFHRLTPRLFVELGKIRANVDVIAQAPSVPDDAGQCPSSDPYTCDLPRHRALPREGQLRRWLGRTMRPLAAGSRLIKFNQPYCDRDRCKGKVDGIYTFLDQWHLSASRTRTLAPYFEPAFRGLGGSGR